MPDQDQQTALALTPTVEKFAHIPLLKLLAEYQVFETLVETRNWILDLAEIAPQVVFLPAELIPSFELSLCDLEIAAKVVSQQEAERIQIENKPLRGAIDLQVRSRGGLSEEMVKQLKADQLISGSRKGKDASDIYHWKDDRWYEDYHLTIFKKDDIPTIEKILNSHGYILAPEDTPK